MNKSLVLGVCGAILVAAGGGTLAFRELSSKEADIVSVKPITAGMEQEYAEVIGVDEIVDPSSPRFATVLATETLTQVGREVEVCKDVVVTKKAPVKDDKQIVGTAAGAVIGAALGHQVGNGNGKKAATALGAIVGGVVGKKVQSEKQNNNTYETTERQCYVEASKDEIKGYKVKYELDGSSNEVFLDYRPTKDLLVVDGRVITNKVEASKLRKSQPPRSYTVSYLYGEEENVLVMPTAPQMGALLLVKEGKVITDPQQLAAIDAHQHDVVAYKVSYKLGGKLEEVRMIDRPEGTTLKIEKGKVVFSEAH